MAAAKQGLDEVKVFREGIKKDGEGGAADGQNEGSASQRSTSAKVQQQLAALQATNRGSRLTNRNTQRNKNKNVLEMEVEKDLTHLKNLLMKKKEMKKLANKENQIVKLEDKSHLLQLVQDLALEKDLYLAWDRQKDLADFKYTEERVLEFDDVITKYRNFRTLIDEKKRLFLLSSGHVTYLKLKRGDVIYEQGKSQADCQYWILSGSVTLIRTFIDQELCFKLEKERRLQRSMVGKDVDASSEDEDDPDKDRLSDPVQAGDHRGGDGPVSRLLSHSTVRDLEPIASISERFSETDGSPRGSQGRQPAASPAPASPSGEEANPAKREEQKEDQSMRCLVVQKANRDRTHKYQEFLHDLSDEEALQAAYEFNNTFIS